MEKKILSVNDELVLNGSEDESKIGKMFTKEELAKYDGTNPEIPIYLAILGRVYDVTKGKYYRKGGGYQFFSGKDGSRAFVTGEFHGEGLKDDVKGLNPSQIYSVREWQDFYDNSDEYFYIGRLIGTYYDEKGKPTEYWKHVYKRIQEALKEKEQEQEEMKLWPPCNTRWSQADGGYVWCSKDSGGIKRDWAGIPRQRFSAVKTEPRCVCVPPEKLNHPSLKLYSNCSPDSIECKTS